MARFQKKKNDSNKRQKSYLNLEKRTKRKMDDLVRGLQKEVSKKKPDIVRISQIIEEGGTELKKRFKAMTHAAARDRKFPAVYTNDYFREKVLRRIGRNLTHSIVYIDIDDFKLKVNSVFGHEVGDRVIRSVTEALEEFSTIHNGFAGRHGGEEFLLFLPLQPYEVAEKLRETFIPKLMSKYKKNRIPQEAQRLISAGIATEMKRNLIKPISAKQKLMIYGSIVRQAIKLMNTAKQQGKARANLHEKLALKFERIA